MAGTIGVLIAGALTEAHVKQKFLRFHYKV